jgi:hypothetical protein
VLLTLRIKVEGGNFPFKVFSTTRLRGKKNTVLGFAFRYGTPIQLLKDVRLVNNPTAKLCHELRETTKQSRNS